jgi:hypothetical protein
VSFSDVVRTSVVMVFKADQCTNEAKQCIIQWVCSLEGDEEVIDRFRLVCFTIHQFFYWDMWRLFWEPWWKAWCWESLKQRTENDIFEIQRLYYILWTSSNSTHII